MSHLQYDLIIVGGGSAGYVGAIRAAQLDKKVLLVEKDKIGGTCLHRGCIPTKTLLHSAQVYANQTKFELFGLSGQIKYDVAKMNERKNVIVDQLADGIESLLDSYHNIEIIQGEATIIDEHTISVGDQAYSSFFILLATGASTRRLENTLSSDDILDFKDKDFDRVVIIGGGVIGLEFAQLYQSLASEVVVLEAQPRLLLPFDKEVSQNLMMIFKRRNTSILTNVSDISVMNNTVSYKHKGSDYSIDADAVIAAIGRQAHIIDSKIEIELEETRYRTDGSGKTSVDTIYAVGDCASAVQLAHMAQAQAVVAVEHMFNEPSSINLGVVPSVVYTSPEIASVGITVVDPQKHVVGKYMMNGHGYTSIYGQDRSFVKLVVDKEKNTLVGATLMCERAGDLISLLVQAIVSEQDVSTLTHMIYPHPSFSEAIVEAVNVIKNQAIHVMPRKK